MTDPNPFGTRPSPGLRGTAMLAVCLMIFLAVGCGPRRPATVRVSGRVLLDGAPLPAAAVLFEPVSGGVPARGSTGSDGTFTLTTFTRGDGALPGRHRVAVSKVVVEGVAAGPDGLEAAPPAGPPTERAVVPTRYADPATSGLEATVAAGADTLEFAIESR